MEAGVTIVLVRHAERDASGADAISAVGKRRADLLARMFRQSGVSAIFTSEFNRTKQTARPLAQATSLAPVELNGTAAQNRDKVIEAGPLAVVIGHSDTTPELIAALGGPADIEIGDAEFDRMFIVTTMNDDAPSVVEFRYVSA
jgi:phosphohistidine phosphatase SixA